MLESFSIQAVKIIEDAKIIAKERNSTVVGSEHLLIAMYETKDSICRFLLQEQQISLEDINNILSKMIIIHKVEHPSIIFTPKFQEIILGAKEIAEKTNNTNVYDEHIFYSLLDDEDSIAFEVLEMLKINTTDMKEDIVEIFNFFGDNLEEIPPPFPFLRKLTKQSRIHPFVKRKDYIERMEYILSKKQKNNPLLIGNAGVGKTALVEGLCEYLHEEDIYQLDLGGVVAGTKYRGELEEKLIKAMEFIKEQNAICFIDEIHNIVGAGSNDGSLDIANILKPYLSRSDMRLIGATTLDEYYQFIEKDKALMRRFQNIFVDEPNKLETYKILMKIKHSYEEYHHVSYSKKQIWNIINKCDIYLFNRHFPDKAIDVLDEVGARAKKFGCLNLDSLIDEVITDTNGITPKSFYEIAKLELYYPELVPYYYRFIERIAPIKHIVCINVKSDFVINPLLTDLEKVFSLKKEMFLEIDLEGFTDQVSLSNLIGSSKGYVGYDQGGLLTEHIIKYPFCVVYFKNFLFAHITIQNYLEKLFQKDFLIDAKNRKISLSNTIFIVDKDNQSTNAIGFEKQKKSEKKNICDISIPTILIDEPKPIYQRLVKKYHLKDDIKVIDKNNVDIVYEAIFEKIKKTF